MQSTCEVCKEEKPICDYQNISCCGSCLGYLAAVEHRLAFFTKFGKMPELTSNPFVNSGEEFSE